MIKPKFGNRTWKSSQHLDASGLSEFLNAPKGAPSSLFKSICIKLLRLSSHVYCRSWVKIIVNRLVVLVLLTSQVLSASVGYALPTGYAVEAGNATFDVSDPSHLIIYASNQAIVNFDSFSIDADESVRVIHEGSDESFFARVVGESDTDIYGSLVSNGTFILVNPNGINFYAGADIQAQNFIASTLELQSAMYLNNQLVFEKSSGSPSGRIYNEADLSLPGGSIAFLSEDILNVGTLTADMGRVVLGIGEKQTLSFDANGLINLVIDRGLSESLGRSITNSGTIRADGGQVLLTAKTFNDTMDTLINNTGLVQASRAVEKDGKVYFVSNGAIQNPGVIRTNVLDEKGYTFKTTGTIEGGKAFYDNIDGAAYISGSIGSDQNDTGNLIVNGGITLTANNLTFTADSDNSGTGIFYMEDGTNINGGATDHYSLTIKSGTTAVTEAPTLAGGETPQLQLFLNIGTLTLDRAGSNSQPVYTANDPMTNLIGLTIQSNVTFDLKGQSLALFVGNFENNGTVRLYGNETINITAGNDTDSGTIEYTGGSGSNTYNELVFGDSYYNLVFSATEDTYILDNTTDINGNLTIGTDSELDGNFNTITVAGNWTNNGGAGGFSANSSTVILDGGDQTITGDTTFYNLTKTESLDNSTDTILTFEEGSTTTVTNVLTLDGRDSNDRINLVSSNPGTRWSLDASGTFSIDYVDVRDSDATGGSQPSYTNTISSGNNLGWGFGQTLTWVGGAIGFTTDFGTATNWDLNATPTIDDTVIVADTANDPIFGAAFSMASLTINSSAVLDLNGFGLTLAGSFVNNGTLKLQGAETLTGFTNDTDSGTIEYTGASGTNSYSSGLIAGDTYWNLTVNGTSDTYILDANLDVNNNIVISAGVLDVKSGSNYQINVGNNWTNSATFEARSGTVVLDATDTGNTLTDGGSNWYNVTFNGSGGGWSFADSTTISNNLTLTQGGLSGITDIVTTNITVNGGTYTGSTGDLDVNGVFSMSSGSFTAPDSSASLTVADDFLVTGGTFTHNGGEVTLDSTTTTTVNVPMAGISFYDLTVATTAGKTVMFTGGDTFNVLSASTFSVGNNATLTSTNTTDWNLSINNAGGASTGISFGSGVNVSYSNNTSTNLIEAYTVADGGNNTRWSFTAPVVPSPDNDTDPNPIPNPTCVELGTCVEPHVIFPWWNWQIQWFPKPDPDHPRPINRNPKPENDEKREQKSITNVEEGAVLVKGMNGEEEMLYDGESMSVSKNGARILKRGIYVSSGEGLLALRGKTYEKMKEFNWENRPTAIAPSHDGKNVYASSTHEKQLIKIENETFSAQSIKGLDEGSSWITLSQEGDRAFSTSAKDDTVQVFDTNTGDLLKEFKVGSMPTSSVLSQDGKTLYVVERLDQSLSTYDAATGEKLNTQKTGVSPHGMILSDQTLYVTDAMTDKVYAVNAKTLQKESEIATGHASYAIQTNPKDPSKLYIADRFGESVTVIDTKTQQFTTIQVGKRPSDIAILPEGDKLYVTNELSNSLSVIDLGLQKMTMEIPVGTAPNRVVIASPERLKR